jgi:hypothetical protein
LALAERPLTQIGNLPTATVCKNLRQPTFRMGSLR